MIRPTRLLCVLTIASLLCLSAIPKNAPAQVRSAAKAEEKEAPRESKQEAAARRAKGEVNFDDLQFDIEKDQAFKDGMLNQVVKQLDGKKIKLRGYILPSTLFKETDISEFVLVRDNQECCFGPGAALFDCVVVKMNPGRTTDFVTRPVTVEGKFKIDTVTYKYPGGVGPKGASHLAIFMIEGERVK